MIHNTVGGFRINSQHLYTPLGELTESDDLWELVVPFYLQAMYPGEKNKVNRLLFVSKNRQRAVAGFIESHSEIATEVVWIERGGQGGQEEDYEQELDFLIW